MRKLNGYEAATVQTQRPALPVGGYVLKILNVDLLEYTWGEVLKLDFDILEGDQKDFFKRDYGMQAGEDKKWKGSYRLNVPKDDGSEQDQWAQNRFKSVIAAFEDSNDKYHWDWNEQGLKGLTVGAVFNNKQYEVNGVTGFFTNCHSLRKADDIRSGNFKIPADTLLKNTTASQNNDTGFVNVPDGIDEELPFN